VRVGLLVRQLRRRSFGGVFLLLAALGLLPGISVLAGLAMLVPGAQLLAGYRAPLLPRALRQRTVDREHLRHLGDLALPWLERLERFVRPRWPALTAPPMPAVVGLLTMGLGLVVVLPLPFSNLPPALAMLCLSLGLLERDGMLVAAGLALAAGALAIGVVIATVAVKASLLLLA